jgi:hypothetical protein
VRDVHRIKLLLLPDRGLSSGGLSFCFPHVHVGATCELRLQPMRIGELPAVL